MVTILYTNSTTVREKRSLEELLRQLPASMHVRAKRYKFEQDAYNFVLGRLLLKKSLNNLGLSTKKIEHLYYNQEGKPFLDGITFSIAHSQNWVACAFAQTGSIGLDLECKRAVTPKHFRHCFSAVEWEDIVSDESLETFYWYWTAKEAVLKANAVGLGHLLDIEIKNEKMAYFHAQNTVSKWYLHSNILVIKGVNSCLCTAQKVGVKTVELFGSSIT